MELQFTTLLADLLHRIAEMGHESYDSHMLTLLNRSFFISKLFIWIRLFSYDFVCFQTNRLDFNNYYTDKDLLQMNCKSTTDDAVSG